MSPIGKYSINWYGFPASSVKYVLDPMWSGWKKYNTLLLFITCHFRGSLPWSTVVLHSDKIVGNRSLILRNHLLQDQYLQWLMYQIQILFWPIRDLLLVYQEVLLFLFLITLDYYQYYYLLNQLIYKLFFQYLNNNCLLYTSSYRVIFITRLAQ